MENIKCLVFIHFLYADDHHSRMEWLHHECYIDRLFSEYSGDLSEWTWVIDILPAYVYIRMIFDRKSRW